MRPSTGLRATNSGCRVVLRVLRSLRSKNRGWRERGASLKTPKQCSLGQRTRPSGVENHSLPR